MTETRDPWLLTPGPLTTSATVKAAMQHDFGSRDKRFIAINRRIRERLLDIAGVRDTHVCVPVQGSGTFAVEATIGTLTRLDSHLLILVNGAYGRRIAKICDYYGRRYTVLESAEDVPNDTDAVEQALRTDPTLSHVVAVHCETTSGILNPIEAVAEITASAGRSLIVDTMSAFGAIELDATQIAFDAVVASANKCLEGVPGLGFAIIRKSVLESCAGNAPSLSLDLYDQWQGLEANAQWRFTPPTHVIAAFDQALTEHEAEGGVAGRGARYRRNCDILIDGMRSMGFVPLLADELQAPIIVTFHMPADPKFDFQNFYNRLSERGFVIYPGKLTVADSFRIGCIGRIGETEIRGALAAIESAIKDMGVSACAPAA